MKQYILFLAACSVLSCSDGNEPNPASGFSQVMADLVIATSGQQLTPESEAIANDMQAAEKEFAVIHTSNYGGTVDVIAGGIVPNSPFISLNGASYTPYSGNSYLNGDIPITWFDGEVCLENSMGNVLACLDAPKIIQCPFLGSANSINLSRTSHPLITWAQDDSNPTRQVAIMIRYYPDDDFMGKPIARKIFVVDDALEKFDITTGMPEETKAVEIIVTRGNAVNFRNGTNDDVLFNVRSCDHHSYIITD